MPASSFWSLDPSVTFLNHGSFGACPKPVLAHQSMWRERLESEPVYFFVRELPTLLDETREKVAAFVGADPKNLAFVRNASSGVNAVLRSLDISPDDELLATNHGYNACLNTLTHVAQRNGARVVAVDLPFPLVSEDQVVEAVLDKVTNRTRLALLDHITSPTGLVLPIRRLVDALKARGVETLVDGAHAPGMITLELEKLGAAYYTANFHKWTCAPKGAAMLWVRADCQEGMHPAVISHGYTARTHRSRFLDEFDWTGTDDPTSWLSIPEALRVVGGQRPGGWPEIQSANRALALRARDILCDALGLDSPAPDAMIGSLAAVPLPPGAGEPPTSALYMDPLQRMLFDRYRIEVPLPPWPKFPARLLRVSAHLYNTEEHYELLARCLREALQHPA